MKKAKTINKCCFEKKNQIVVCKDFSYVCKKCGRYTYGNKDNQNILTREESKKLGHEWRLCLRHFYWMPDRLGGKTWEAEDDDGISGQGKTAEKALLDYLKNRNI